jgi:predicted enzyme related to lactoylglutathione lyase
MHTARMTGRLRHHAIDYIEIPVTDVARAKQFYADASLAAVQAAGGTAERPFEFPGGRRFHFTDPSGNRLGVWAQP